ncbi:MAG: hypothetical protein HRU03_05415 [Nanoarchaeales archaeon]|nr:hypothetical protein [Nanoarchaeales archaeon]
MNNIDRNNLAEFQGIKPYISLISGRIMGIKGHIKKIQENKYKTQIELMKSFNDKYPKQQEQFETFKTQIENIKKTQSENKSYNFEIIDDIYNQILEIIIVLEKINQFKFDSNDFNSKDIQYYEIKTLNDLLTKLNTLKKTRFSDIFKGDYTNVKIYGGIFNPLNWFKK